MIGSVTYSYKSNAEIGKPRQSVAAAMLENANKHTKKMQPYRQYKRITKSGLSDNTQSGRV
jgi:hypothetical protein